MVNNVETKDEQRAFQLLVARLLAEGGVHGLAARWRDLASPQWREVLVSEIVEEGTSELLAASLDDPDDKVVRRAMKLLTSCRREPPAKERREIAKTLRGRAALEAWGQATVWMTPARRARIAKAVTAALDRCADTPKALTWPDDYIELLGHRATRTEQRAITLLEEFRMMAGEARRSEFEALDPERLPAPTSIRAEEKGIPPGTPFVRVWSIPSGLLDRKGLEGAIERIRQTVILRIGAL